MNAFDLPEPSETPNEPAPRPHPVAFDMTPMDPIRDLFDHDFDPPPKAYDPVWTMPLDQSGLKFKDDTLTMAVSCIRMYLELRDHTYWAHVKVRTLAYASFLRAMDEDAGRTMTLPFSSWCDGGTPVEARLRQHRHFIVVAPSEEHFKRKVWSKVAPEDRPRRNFRCVLSDPIVSAMHLVNTIGYVCKRRSECNFSGNRPEKNNHFHLFYALPKDYRLPLVLQWDGGLLELLKQEFKNMKKGELVRANLNFFQGKWRFRIRDIPGIALGTVLPVAADFEPCPHETEYSLRLVNGRRLHFQRNPELLRLTPEAWLQRQADLGNLFFHAVGTEMFTPRPFHQGLISEFKPLVDRNRELEAQVVCLKRKCEELEAGPSKGRRQSV